MAVAMVEEEKCLEPEREPGPESDSDLSIAAVNLSNALNSKQNLTMEEIRILGDLRYRLNQIVAAAQDCFDENEARFQAIVRKIESWKFDSSMIWGSDPSQASEYLKAADENRKVIEKLEALGSSRTDDEEEKLQKAYSLRQDAMERLEDEFKHILLQNRLFLGEDKTFSLSPLDDTTEFRSSMSPGNLSLESSARRDSLGRFSDDGTFDMINSGVISDLKSIVNLMFSSTYAPECTNAYIMSRKSALEDALVLKMETTSIEDVLKLEMNKKLDSMMMNWIHCLKTFVTGCLARERILAEQLFSDHEDVYLICFCEASKPSMSQLLNFGEAITIGPHRPEKIGRMLRIYEVLTDLLPQIDYMFMKEPGCHLRNRYHELLSTLGGSIASAFDDFWTHLVMIDSTRPVRGGNIHPLTKCVMKFLISYQSTLDVLLKEKASSSEASSPMANRFINLVSAMEAKIEENAKAYGDSPLRHIFLMNNIHYIVGKIKDTDLHPVFGDSWIRQRICLFRQQATKYQQATWSSVLDILKYEKEPSKKFRRFNLAFDEVWRLHMTWVIPDAGLRADVQIMSANNLLPAYRCLYEKWGSDKHARYSEDELRDRLYDFFEKSCQTSHRGGLYSYFE